MPHRDQATTNPTNELICPGTGLVVYLTWDGGWSEQVAESFISGREEENAWLLDLAKCPSGDFMSRMNRLSGAPS